MPRQFLRHPGVQTSRDQSRDVLMAEAIKIKYAALGILERDLRGRQVEAEHLGGTTMPRARPDFRVQILHERLRGKPLLKFIV